MARGIGEAGQIALTAPTITIDSGIIGNIPPGGLATLPATLGRTGTIAVQGGRVTLTNGGAIHSSNTTSLPGGSILVAATETLLIAGTSTDQYRSDIATLTFGAGDAGHIAISTPVLTLQGGELSSGANSSGRPGNISVHAGTMLLTDSAGIFIATLDNTGNRRTAMTITADVLEMRQAEIASNTYGPDHGGTVHITATKLTMAASLIQSQATPGSTGDAGDIVLTLGQGTLTGGSTIESSTQGIGPGGTINLTASTLDLHNARIFSNTQGPGRAGTVSLTASTLAMDGGGIQAETMGAGRGGDIHVTATELRMDGGRIAASTLSDGQAGEIMVEVQRLVLEAGSSLSSASGVTDATGVLRVGTGAAGKVTISATDTVLLAGDSVIDTDTAGGPGGRILVTTPTLRLEGGSAIKAETVGRDAAGDIQVTATRVDMRGAFISTSTSSDGRAGNVGIHTESLTLREGAGLFSASGVIDVTEQIIAGTGAAGAITVQAAGDVSLTGMSIMSTQTAGGGDGGQITLTAPRLKLDDAGVTARTFGMRQAGDIGITVGQLTLTNGAFIDSTTAGVGPGGHVTVSAPRVNLMDRGQISTSTGGDGRAGDVVLQVGHLDLASGAQLSSASGILVGDQRFVGDGAGGTVRVTATETVRMSGHNSGLSTTTMGGGRGGDILVQAAQVQMAEGATIIAQGTGAGDAGRVALTTSGAVQSAHSAVTTTATTGAGGVIQVTAGTAIDLTETDMSATVTGGSRPGGSVTLTTPVLTLTGGRLAAETQGAGNAGNLTLNVERVTAQGATLTSSSTATATGDAGTITLQGLGGPGTLATRLTLTGSVVATEATVADGGNIAILAQGTLRLRDSQLTTAVRSGVGRGGNILIDPEFVILERSQIRADAFGGPGGNIRLVAKGFLTDADSRVSASSAQSVQGTIAIEAFTNPSGLVAPLPTEFILLTTLLSTRCAARLREGRVGSFLVGGRDGLPADPEGGLPSLPVQGGLEAEPGQPLARLALGKPDPLGRWEAPWLLRLWGDTIPECGPGTRW